MHIKGSHFPPCPAEPLAPAKEKENQAAHPVTDVAKPDGTHPSAAKTTAPLGKSLSYRLQTEFANNGQKQSRRSAKGRRGIPADGSATMAETRSTESADLVSPHNPITSAFSPATAMTRYFFGGQEESAAAHEYLSKHLSAVIGFNKQTVAAELAQWGNERLKQLGRCGF
jgi:hypothetical protein